ncbi:MAG: sigma 54-interacting transcriptional regulator [Planctomycetes bacterium]|nr:sigma 54-interacting transcriptional regulator [Planctomycetota bacterium]
MAYLTVRTEEGRKLIELGDSCIIGRGVSCEVLLDDPRASKKHAEVRQVNGRYLLRDLGSTNGTLLGGETLKNEISLQDGDEFSIGQATLVFTRHYPPGTQTALARMRSTVAGSDLTPPLDEKSGVLMPDEKGLGRVPRGTLVVPVERFGLRPMVGKSFETTILESPQLVSDRTQWLHCLYRMLREANQCETEDGLFEAATRILGEALPGSKVQVVFEAAVAGDDGKREKDIQLTVWAPPGSRTTRLLDDHMAGARTVLLRHARERGVAVLSPDVELDPLVAEAVVKDKTASRVLVRKELEAEKDRERFALMIAPLLTGRTALGYLVMERAYRLAGRREPFTQEHLEFLAAAAYPLATMLDNLRRRQSVVEENTRLRMTIQGKHEMVGDSPRLREVLGFVQRVAPVDSPVLILGESGTGKELVARAIHSYSRRAQGPFEAINCAALPENLVESELFGHAKGAFTGATRDRAGIFEIASGGTLFLDEIGELPAPVQAKLLRVLEESKVSRVGESRLRSIDCRIVCATNRDLAAEVEAGQFRQDLYYRLRVMEILLPPLRERLDDLALLCTHLLEPFGNYALHPDVLAVFRRYAWPGNIRELRNTLERMAVLSRPGGRGGTRSGVVTLTVLDIPLDIRRAVEHPSVPPSGAHPAGLSAAGDAAATNAPHTFAIRAPEMPLLEVLQVQYARWVLEQVEGNKTQAAKILGIQRSTLYAWTEWGEKGKNKDKKKD